jgi:hypothetical protein
MRWASAWEEKDPPWEHPAARESRIPPSDRRVAATVREILSRESMSTQLLQGCSSPRRSCRMECIGLAGSELNILPQPRWCAGAVHQLLDFARGA